MSECSKEASKSKKQQGGESKGQDRELMASGDGCTELNLLLDTLLEMCKS